MKLVMTLLVRNEEDIIKQNIDYHLSQGVDFIIATDNRSIDSTKTILKNYERKGVLHYIYENENTHNQGKWVTKMARMAHDIFQADWVINNDADEFWWPLKNRNLKEAFVLQHLNYNIVEAKRHNFVALEQQNKVLPFYTTMIYKEVNSYNSIGDPLPPKQAHKATNNIKVGEGNHSVSGFTNKNINRDLIEILHFPVRSKKQFTNKILNGGNALLNNQELPNHIGITWRKLYNQLVENGNLEIFLKENTYNHSDLKASLDNKILVKDTRLYNHFRILYTSCKTTHP